MSDILQKPFADNPNYIIYSDGRIYSLYKKDFLTPYLTSNGYKRIKLIIQGQPKNFAVHRIIAQTFIPNPNNLPQVNHKDENKTNNNINNLEWCSAEYNSNFGTKGKRQSNTQKNRQDCSKQVAMCDLSTKEIIKIFPSMSEAHRQTHIAISDISKVCSGKRQSAGGFF